MEKNTFFNKIQDWKDGKTGNLHMGIHHGTAEHHN